MRFSQLRSLALVLMFAASVVAFLVAVRDGDAVVTETASPDSVRGPSQPLNERAPRLASRRADKGLEPAEPTAAQDEEQEFDFRGPSMVAGQIVDSSDRPLAGIPLYLAFEVPATYEIPDQRVLFAEGADIEEGLVVARKYGGHVLSDADGRFQLDARSTRSLSSGDGRVRVVPAHPSWMEAKRRRTKEGGILRFDSAASLTVRVVDEGASPIPEFIAIVREASRRGDRSVAAKNGGFVMQWRRTVDLPASVQPSVVVWAQGRSIERRSVTIPASEQSLSITINLGLRRQDGLLRLWPATGHDATEEPPVIVVLSLPERPDDEVFRAKVTRAEPDAALSASVPPGRFRVRAFGPSAVRREPVLDEEMEFAPGLTVEGRYAIPR